MVDLSERAALERRKELQHQLLEVGISSFRPRTARDCFRMIQSHLIKASDLGLLEQSPAQVRALVKLSEKNTTGTSDIAVGNVRNFHRVRSLPHFSRPDGAWFDFQLLVRERKDEASIIAYGFELRMSDGRPFPFIRFDFNPPGHDNDDDGLRSHLHLGTDDDGFSIPAPFMSPLAILDLFLLRLRPGPRRRA